MRLRDGGHLVKQIVIGLLDRVLHGAVVPEAQVDDGVSLPIVGLVVKRQPPEELTLPLEDGLERREQQRLPEAARAGEEIHRLGGPDQPPDMLRLVHIEEVPQDQILERVYACRQIFHEIPPFFAMPEVRQ